jgi:hypothetical protein
MTVPFVGDGTRYCTHCQTRNRAIEDGYWKLTRGGLHKRWICGACVSRVREKARKREVDAAAGRAPGGQSIGGVADVHRGEVGNEVA